MALRVCAQPGCPELIPTGTRDGRCDQHRRERDRARGTRQQRGYDADYDARRAADAQAMRNGTVFTCWRCGRPIQPHDYSLGHCDDTKAVIHGPEHYHQCNQAAANKSAPCPHPSHG